MTLKATDDNNRTSSGAPTVLVNGEHISNHCELKDDVMSIPGSDFWAEMKPLLKRPGFTQITLLAVVLVLLGCPGHDGPTTPSPAVTAVTVTPPTATVAAGREVQLTASVAADAGAATTVTWSSSSSATATVDGTGAVHGVAVGTATVRATSTYDHTKQGTSTITVVPPPVATVAVTPAAESVAVGASLQLTATPRDVDGTLLTGRSVSWQTSAPAVATVSDAGLVTAVAVGTVTITATVEERNGTATVAVVEVVPASPTAVQAIVLSPVAVEVHWTDNSDNESEFRVEREIVAGGAGQPPSAGFTQVGAVGPNVSIFRDITVQGETTYRYRVRSCTSTVCSAPSEASGELAVLAVVVSMDVSPGNPEIRLGESTQLTATPRDAQGHPLSGRSIVWTSRGSLVANVLADGTVQGIGPGQAVIEASFGGIVGAATVTVSTESAGLVPQDIADLTAAFETLAVGWDPPAIGVAWQVFNKHEYDADDWKSFFFRYFATHSLTEDLWNYLGYPVFYWLDAGRRGVLQSALWAVATSQITAITVNHRDGLGQYLLQNPGAAESVSMFHLFLAANLSTTVVPALVGETLNFYRAHVLAFPEFYSKQYTIDIYQSPLVAALRRPVYANLIGALKLTGTDLGEVVSLLGLTGDYEALWTESGVLLIDNNGLDHGQITVVREMLRLIPRELLTENFRAISVLDLLRGTQEPRYRFNTPANAWMVNIFDASVQVFPPGPFPGDVTPVPSGTFAEVLAHELNHIVAYGLSKNSAMQARVDELIAHAGAESLNYLRSMLEPGFFVAAPQEFLASIANQWFTRSSVCFDLARLRLDLGRPEPMNQALFFAEVYSLGGPVSYFYANRSDGGVDRVEVPVERDGNGHISRMTIDGVTWTFVRALNGDVISVTVG